MSKDYIKTSKGWVKREKHFRLVGYDYSSKGMYFVTIVSQDRIHYFGEVENGKMVLNKIGEMVQNYWLMIGRFIGSFPEESAPVGIPIKGIPTEYFNKSEILLDQFIIMPNHIHGIIIFEKSNNLSLGEIIGAFKSLTTNEYIKQVKENNWPRFENKFWQSRFYDRIIRTDREFSNIQKYIINNPKNIRGMSFEV